MIRSAPHLLGGENTEEPDRAVADDRYRRAGLHIRCIGGEPGGTHDVGERQQARDQVLRRNARCGHQGAVRERDA